MGKADPWQVVRDFESAVAEYAGSRYAVAVDTGTAAIFLACKYLKVQRVTIPCRTYCSVPCSIIHAGGSVGFWNREWKGSYRLGPYPILDSACRFTRGMFRAENECGDSWYSCLSFQYRKHLKIGRGGMILTDDPVAVDWFRLARFSGRHEVPLMEDSPSMVGWSCYMEPERAARGLTLLSMMPDHNEDLRFEYPDLSKFPIYQQRMERQSKETVDWPPADSPFALDSPFVGF
jgi:dTDP-4-amino-4,6-dideoxygalactose transaminase